MSRNTKTVLIVIGGLLVLCICSCVGLSILSPFLGGLFLSQSMATNPADVAAIGDKIADYETPSGYTTDFGMSLMGFDLVGITSGGKTPELVIFMMQFPQWANTDPASMEQQLEQSVERQLNSRELKLETVKEEKVTLRDQPVTLTIREGKNGDGVAVRQVTGVFEGKGGPTMLMILGPIEGWDQAAVDQFLSSIR